jgi:uncharacterized iron-regulated protein
MKTALSALGLIFLLANICHAQEAALLTSVRKLEKDIANVRGMPFKQPVEAKIIPRPKDTGKSVQGYYSIKDKTLFIYDDIAGNYERGVLIHEMVHAWQDQQFGLAKLHQSSFGTDAELALAALIEGDATFTMIELLKDDQPAVAKMLESPLEKSKNLRNAFLYAQGARYVKALKERGGWAAVNSAYKFPPRSTARILFPDVFPSTIQLGPGKTKGAYGIVELFASNPETADNAVSSARGWIGDRYFEDKDTQAWIVASASAKDAQQFQKTAVKLRQARMPMLKVVSDGPNGQIAQDDNGAVYAEFIAGNRVWVLKTSTQKQLQALRDRLEAPPLTVWSRADKRFISFGQFVDKLADADVVCVGETHDSELHHHVQLRIVKALFANDERLGIGLEMFQRPFQPALDRYVGGKIAEDAFLKESEYTQRWGFDWSLYRPIVEFSRKNNIGIAALNVPRELTQRLSKVGRDGLTPMEKAQLGDIDFHVKEHRDHWYELLGKMHGKTDTPADQKERSYQVMAAWDGFMADSAARFQTERKLRRMVVLAGSGHIERGFGIPDRAAKRTGGKAVTIGVAVDRKIETLAADPTTDYVVIVR